MANVRSFAGIPGARIVLVVAAVTLFGLLSMHVWGTHAGTGPESTHSALLPDAAQAIDATRGTRAPGEIIGNRAASSAICGDDCDDSDVGLALLGLCLAVISGLVGVFVLLRPRHCGHLLRTLMPTCRRPVFLGRDRDPPDLLRLCVIRC